MTSSSLPKYLTIFVPSDVTSALPSILKCRFPRATAISISGQPTNADPSISSVDAGITTDDNLHPAKAYSPILLSLGESPNAIAAILTHFSKDRSPIASTDSGKVNASNVTHPDNAPSPISRNLVPDAKAIPVMDVAQVNAFAPMTSMLAGITIL
jgi:hypothetical protein